jgi:hypothetical protein
LGLVTQFNQANEELDTLVKTLNMQAAAKSAQSWAHYNLRTLWRAGCKGLARLQCRFEELEILDPKYDHAIETRLKKNEKPYLNISAGRGEIFEIKITKKYAVIIKREDERPEMQYRHLQAVRSFIMEYYESGLSKCDADMVTKLIAEDELVQNRLRLSKGRRLTPEEIMDRHLILWQRIPIRSKLTNQMPVHNFLRR